MYLETTHTTGLVELGDEELAGLSGGAVALPRPRHLFPTNCYAPMDVCIPRPPPPPPPRPRRCFQFNGKQICLPLMNY
jgi:hypothetical protein